MTKWSACSTCASSPRATVRGPAKAPRNASYRLSKAAAAAHELAYDAAQKPEHRLQKLLEHSEEELSSPRNQRKVSVNALHFSQLVY